MRKSFFQAVLFWKSRAIHSFLNWRATVFDVHGKCYTQFLFFKNMTRYTFRWYWFRAVYISLILISGCIHFADINLRAILSLAIYGLLKYQLEFFFLQSEHRGISCSLGSTSTLYNDKSEPGLHVVTEYYPPPHVEMMLDY